MKYLLPVLGLWLFQVVPAQGDVRLHPVAYAGTYAIRFCRGSCPAATYRSGTLVISGQPLRDPQGHVHAKWLEQGHINGCLILDPVHGTPGGWVFYPGLAIRRFIAWSVLDNHAMRFELDRTVDAGYTVELRPTPSGLGGTGMFWSASGPPGAPQTAQRDEVRAHRLGDADPARCPRLEGDLDEDRVFGTGVLRP